MKLTRLYMYIVCFICLFSCESRQVKQFKIGVSLCNDDLWHQTVIKDLNHEASFYPHLELEIKENRNGDDQQQIENLQTFISQQKDLIIVSAGNASLISPIIEKAYNLNIPILVLDQKVETNDYTAYIGGNNYMIGQEAGKLVVKELNGKGNVAVIRGRTESLTDIERYKGFMDVIAEFPDVHLIAEEKADFNTELAEKRMIEIIRKNLPIDILFAMDDLTAKGVYNAYNKEGKPRPFTIGVDALTGEGGGIDNIIKGYQEVSFIYPTGGDEAVQLANRILLNQPFQKNTLLYTGIVDRSNAHLIKEQKESIFNERKKSAKTVNQLTRISTEYFYQRTLFHISIFILLVIVLLLVITIHAYRSKSKAKNALAKQYTQIEKQNLEILHQNEEIKRQATILLSQKQQLETLTKELEEATHAKLTFFTNISHEFKTPLSLIIDPLKTLLQSQSLAKEDKYKIELINRNCKILLNLISQLIDFNKYENYSQDLQIGPYDLYHTLSNLNELFQELTIQKQIEFHFHADKDIFCMYFDKEKIERSYLNVLSNAFNHVPQNGIIEVTLNKTTIDDKEYADIRIFNNGVPIPEDQINNIFNRFYKVDSSGIGTGIGLALTNTLISLHQGKISAHNKNNGVEFQILLPFQQASSQDATDPFLPEEQTDITIDYNERSTETIHEENSPHKTTILIIEDNQDIRNYLTHILNKEYKIVEAPDGKAGLEKAKKYLPEVIISDVMMPEMDGLELCREIKENISTCHIPVILLTARSLNEHEIEGIEHGADVYIKKPFDSQFLILRLHKLIENRKKIREAFNNSFIEESGNKTVGYDEEEYIKRFQNYVLNHITDSSLNIEVIAEEFGESYIQMYRKIKSLTGQTPIELVKIIRLKYARQRLNLKTENIATVAYESGFSSPSYFTRCFKEFYKESPTEYLKRIN